MKEDFIKVWEKIRTKYDNAKIVKEFINTLYTRTAEWMYLIIVMLMVFSCGIITTMFRSANGLAALLVRIDFLVVTLLWVKVLLGAFRKLNRLMVCMAVVFVLQNITVAVGNDAVMVLGLLVIAADEVDFRKIIKAYLISILLVMLAAFVAAEMGYIQNLKYFVGDRGFRYALGGIYPTDTMCHIFFITLGILYLLKEKFRIWMACVAGIVLYIPYHYTNAQTGWLCTVLALIGYCIVWMLENKCKGFEKKFEKKVTIIRRVLIWSMPIGAICFAGIVGWYMRWNRLRTYFPRTIASRIGMTARAIRQYGIPMFGCPITMRGAGGSTIMPKDYFYIDCSYMWVLFVYGLVVLLLFLGLFVLLGYKFKNDWYMLIILFVIALDCTIEHHLTDISYNIFMVALLADCGANKFNSKKNREIKAI